MTFLPPIPPEPTAVPADEFERRHLGAETVTLTHGPPEATPAVHVGLFDARILRAAFGPCADDPAACADRRRALLCASGVDPTRPYRVFRNVGSPRYYIVQTAAAADA